LKKLILYIALLHNTLVAQELNFSLGLDIGESRDGIGIYRIGIQKDFETIFYENESLLISGYHEASLNFWDGKNTDLWAVAYSPVFTLNFITMSEYTPYFDLGIGIAAVSKKYTDYRNLSSHFQFEDRFGFGIKRANLDFHVRYMHYSNAGLKKPNDGIDIFLAGFGYKF